MYVKCYCNTKSTRAFLACLLSTFLHLAANSWQPLHLLTKLSAAIFSCYCHWPSGWCAQSPWPHTRCFQIVTRLFNVSSSPFCKTTFLNFFSCSSSCGRHLVHFLLTPRAPSIFFLLMHDWTYWIVIPGTAHFFLVTDVRVAQSSLRCSQALRQLLPRFPMLVSIRHSFLHNLTK